jgi:hypothetical protein
MNLTTRFNDWLVDQLNNFLHLLPSALVVGLIMGLALLFLGAAGRMAGFNRPNWLHRNTMMRLAGHVLGMVATGTSIITALTISIAGIVAYLAGVLDQLTQLLQMHLQWGAIGAAAGLLTGLALRWFFIPNWEKEEGLSFVDRDIALQGSKKGFDPRPFFTQQNHGGVFIGKDQQDNPVGLSWATFNSTHIPVVGATGSGKGVALQTLASQAHRAGQTVIIFDPKPCEILPRVLAQEAKSTKRAMHLIDLRQRVPAVNPLSGLNPERMTDLLIEALELKKTGEPKSDHYKEQAQRSVRRLVDVVTERNRSHTFQQLFAIAQSYPDIAESENLLSGLEKFAHFEQFNTLAGLNLQKAIADGDIIYFAGDGSSEDLATVQRTLLSRVMQILADREDESRHVCLVIDELGDLLTGTVLALLSKVRSRKTHTLLAFQTPGNLRLARGIDPDVAFSACWGNTTVKIIYRLEEYQYAEEIAKRIGPEPTQIRSVTRDNATNTTRESWTQSNRLKVEPHEITNLPMPASGSGQAAMGFLVGAGPAQKLYLGPVPINLETPLPEAFYAAPAAKPTVAEEKI